MKHFVNVHDPRLPLWGPYNKDFGGLSHVADPDLGLRFDLIVAPGVYRNKILLPNAMYDSGYHPTEAAPDLTYFSHRHQIEWKDQVYCDISFSELSESSRLIRCEAVNRTDSLQSLTVHFIASMQAYNRLHKLNGADPLRVSRVALPEGASWVDALDYSDIYYEDKSMNTAMISGGLLRGEVRGHGFVGGSGLTFGQHPNDKISYNVTINGTIEQASMVVRYKSSHLQGAVIRVTWTNGYGFKRKAAFILEGIDALGTVNVPIGQLPAGAYQVSFCAEQNSEELWLDGFVLTRSSETSQIDFTEILPSFVPERLPGPTPDSIVLKYSNSDVYYGLKWTAEPVDFREVHHYPLDEFMRVHSRRNATKTYVGNGLGHFTDIYFRPVNVAPRSSRILYGMVFSGTKEDVLLQLTDFQADEAECERLYTIKKQRAVAPLSNSTGSCYRFSQQRLAATTLQNIVYPIYLRRSYIRHFTPGRFWDSLYTWDSGFIGIGLCDIDIERASDVLNAYVTEPGDRHASFIHHGSIVPVQHYLYMELWNRTRSMELLAFFYPRLKQYYMFYAGHAEGSLMRQLRSQLLNPFAYFYNSGGWDDYPAQEYVHHNKLSALTAPVVTTAHAIRIAKILKMAAYQLGNLESDIQLYESDIAAWTGALQQYSWDEQSGYFAYVLHNEQGEPYGILKHPDGDNYNKGLDGIQPLIAGAVTTIQERRILDHLSDPGRLWSDVGISTVDQSAPYYRHDGYWNGSVWMPHQWFIWKALLDAGFGQIAEKIATTSLNVWKRSVEETYNTAEHFIIETGKGAGWHHFGGLSSPVLNWFAALYRPGTVTAGFDTWITDVRFAPYYAQADIRLIKYSSKQGLLLVVLAEGTEYRAEADGTPLQTRTLHAGTIEITLPALEWSGTVSIRTAH
jgi:hypothetical protein